MDEIRNELHRVLTREVLDEIIDLTSQAISSNYRTISERAATMADARTYQTLLDYCFEHVSQYIDNRDNMMKLLLDSKNIQPVYHYMVSTPEFEAICSEEYRGFPRVIAMTVLAGSEAAAADAALRVLNGEPAPVVDYLESQVETYQKYLRDAVSYGKGEDKKVVMTGSKQ